VATPKKITNGGSVGLIRQPLKRDILYKIQIAYLFDCMVASAVYFRFAQNDSGER